jgi:subtilisin
MLAAASSRDRPVRSAIAAAAMVFLIFSLIIFQASVARSSTPQSQSRFGFVQMPLPLPLPLPNPTSRSMQSQPNLANHTQQTVNYTQQTVNYTQQSVNNSLSVSNNTVREVAASDAVVIPDQYIIVLKSGAHPHTSSILDKVKNSVEEKVMKTITDKLRKLDASIIFTNNFAFGGFSAKIPDSNALNIIKQDPNVAFIEQDKLVHINSQILPTGIKRIGADHSSAISGNGVGNDVDADIAILDTGISLNHPDLNVYRQQTFVANTTTANDDNGHGTHVAGIAAAKDNSIGVVGVAPGARLWAVKVLDKDGAGAISTIIKGIDYVTQHANEIDVVNLSFGCECNSPALDAAINSSVQAGVPYTVAAGNDHKDASTFSPANDPNVMAVAAIADSDGKCGATGGPTNHGNDDSLADFSNYGKAISISAPGVNILSTYKDNSYTTLSGTSMASPFVAGAAALYKSFHKSASPSEVRSALLNEGSTALTTCDGDGRGYFVGDPDSLHEPLLYVGGL